VDSGRVALDPEAPILKPDGVDVHPSFTAGCKLHPQRQPVCLDDVAESLKSGHATCVLAGVHRQIQVAMKSGLGANEKVRAPASSYPVADRSLL